MMQCTTEELHTQVAQKQRELIEMEMMRSQALERDLVKLRKELEEKNTQFEQLKDGYKHNLKLLRERDAELDKYDSVFRDLKSQIIAKERDLSDIKIRVSDLELQLTKERQDKEDVHKHFQKRFREKQAELEKYCANKDSEIVSERKDIETYKQKLERRVIELEGELDTQRRELNTGFDSAMKKREHEFRLQLEEISARFKAEECKAKLQEGEIQMLRKDKEMHDAEIRNAEENCRHAEKDLKQTQWQKDDELAIANSRLEDMQLKVDNAEAALKRGRAEFERKHAELDSRTKEKEQLLHRVKDAAAEKERIFQMEINNLKERIEEGDAIYKQLQWDKEELEKQLEQRIEQLQDENNQLTDQLRNHESDMFSARTTTEREVEVLQEQVGHFKVQIDERKKDIERYKRDLRNAAERESKLEQAKAQLGLDWQRKCEEMENKQYEKSEDLVKSLTKSRDAALAQKDEGERELQHKDQLIQMLTVERQQAFASLKKYNITIDRDIEYDIDNLPPSIADYVENLRDETDRLKKIIRDMREGMNVQSVTQEEVERLNTELRELKEKQRRERNLQKLDAMAEGVDTNELTGGNVLVRAHIDGLNDTIAQLRTEKVELSATVRKQQSQLLHLESKIEQMSKTPKEQESTLLDVQYKLGAMERRYKAEIMGLEQKIEHIQGQLAESHSMADSYHQDLTKVNAENASLRQQLSASKIDAAEGRPTVNFGAQELLIQQHQDEIHRLRKQLIERGTNGFESDKPVKGSTQLKAKLGQAVEQIKTLAKEKKQLIEVNNRLRAQLMNKENLLEEHFTPGAPQFPSQAPKGLVPSELGARMTSKLKELEGMQYELTKQELTRQRQDAPPKSFIPPQVFRSDEYDGEIKSIMKKPSLPSPVRFSDTDPMRSARQRETSRKYGITMDSAEELKSVRKSSESPLSIVSEYPGMNDALRMSLMSETSVGTDVNNAFNLLNDAASVASDLTSARKSPHRSNPFSTQQIEVEGKPASLAQRPVSQPAPKTPPTRQRGARRGSGVAQRGRGGMKPSNYNLLKQASAK